jgi:hypothetical protein
MNKAETEPEETKTVPEGEEAATPEKVEPEATASGGGANIASVKDTAETPTSSGDVGGTTTSVVADAATSSADDEATADKIASKLDDDTVPKKRKATETFKPRRKKPRDAPRRPLSAYNICKLNKSSQDLLCAEA